VTDDFIKNTGNQTKESVLELMANYIRDSEEKVVPITSCHSTVAYWIMDSAELGPSDEIVLLGPNPDDDLVYHSIIIRDGDIIGDHERAAPNREIDTTYNAETGIYKTKMTNDSVGDEAYYTLERINLAEFREQYLKEEQPQPDVNGPGSDIDSSFDF